MQPIPYPLSIKFLAKRPVFALFLPTDILDTAGRPLLENRTLRYRDLRGSPIACPYTDYRADTGKPINIVALKEFNRNAQQVHAALSRYCQMSKLAGASGCGEPSAQDLWRMAQLGFTFVAKSCIPALLRGEHPTVTVGDAGAYKICRGLVDFSNLIMAKHGEHTLLDVGSVLEATKQHQSLIGAREVCAAPMSLIERVMSSILRDLRHMTADSFVGPEVRFAAIYSAVEYLCIVYELVRCRRWCLEGRDGATPPSRKAFARWKEAQDAASSPESAQEELEMVKARWWGGVLPHLDQARDTFEGEAQKLLSLGSLDHAAQRSFVQASLCVANSANDELRQMNWFANSDQQARITDTDLYHFLGSLPMES